MLTSTVLDDALASVRAAASAESDPVAALARAADALMASMVALLARRPVLSADGLPAEMALSLKARMPGYDARAAVRACATLSSMPKLAAALGRGEVSFAQARLISGSVKVCDARQRARIDDLISRNAARLSHADPDELVRLVDDEVYRLRSDLAAAREDRAIAARFLYFQPSLDGRATIYGEGDIASVATICQAASAAAPPPHATATRAQGIFDGLLRVSETYLGGGAAGAAAPDPGQAGAPRRARPRFLATVALRDLVDAAQGHGSRLLWAMAGDPGRLTWLSTETLSCDAGVIPVIFDGAQPVATLDEIRAVPERVRRALIARDQGCRFPACDMPSDFTDAHHIRHRSRGGDSDVRNLVLLCRRCHRRIHRHRWTITMRDDGSIAFTWRGQTSISPPRAGPARLE